MPRRCHPRDVRRLARKALPEGEPSGARDRKRPRQPPSGASLPVVDGQTGGGGPGARWEGDEDESRLEESRRAAEELLEGIRGEEDRDTTASAIEAVGAMIAWRMGGGEMILCEAEPTERSLRLGFVHAGEDLSRHLYALHADSMELCKLEPTAEVVERDCLAITKALDSGYGDIHIAEAIERVGVPGLERIHFKGDGRTKRGAGWVLEGEGGQDEPAMVDRVLRELSGALASRITGDRALERWRDAVLQPSADSGDEGSSGETERLRSGRKAGRDLAMVKVTTSRTLEPILLQLRSFFLVHPSDGEASASAGQSSAAGRAPAQRNQIARIQDVSDFLLFKHDACAEEERGQEVRITSEDLHKKFKDWCIENERAKQQCEIFCKIVISILGGDVACKFRQAPQGGGTRQVRGIKIRWSDVLSRL